MASYSASYSSGQFRVLEIRLPLSNLKFEKKRARIYMNLWIHPDRKLQTRVVNLRTGSNFDLEEKFVFSLSENFLRSANATIFFEIYRSRKLLRDSIVGIGQCDLNSLFDNSADEIEKDVIYDCERSEQEEDPRYGNMYATGEESSNDDDGSPELKASATVEVRKSGRLKGNLCFDAIVWKGYMACVGEAKWRNLAMAYQDFMLHKESNERKRSWLCFVAGTDQL